MKKTGLAALLAFALAITLGMGAWAQDNKAGAGGQGQDQNRGQSGKQKIRGVVAEITAEGEMVLDYRTNRAVLAEAAYVTVVGAPEKGHEGASARRTGGQAGDNQSGKDRENIYIVWLSPRTKVCEAGNAGGRAGQKKETSLDRVEVGDTVEIEFTPHEETAGHPGASQTAQMRQKHGRDRTHVGEAEEITILPSKHESGKSDGSR
jgi:hypothetical protein